MTLRLAGEPAWVLHRRPLRDARSLLDVLCRGAGRLTLVARGAEKGRRAAELQPFVPLAIDLQRRSELGSLHRHEATAPRLMLSGVALWSGFYLNELVLRLLPADTGDADLFDAYGVALRGLAAEAPAPVLRHFEYRLLSHLGYALDPGADAQGRALDPAARYDWDAAHGLQRSSSGVSGRAVLALVDGADDERITATQPLLGAMIEAQLAGRPLRTASMLRDLVSLRRGRQGVSAATTLPTP